ncbi:uncharacterized protein EI90DRAFT_3071668, partial [Cantharellus anzutake]|uniref:uncharacterized protein n=1 Tax=Cantharellus anzutake TaxID=1750568 RepID=UPI001906FEF7
MVKFLIFLCFNTIELYFHIVELAPTASPHSSLNDDHGTDGHSDLGRSPASIGNSDPALDPPHISPAELLYTITISWVPNTRLQT